jgi:hypothetical protein
LIKGISGIIKAASSGNMVSKEVFGGSGGAKRGGEMIRGTLIKD